jgi:TolB-like protein
MTLRAALLTMAVVSATVAGSPMAPARPSLFAGADFAAAVGKISDLSFSRDGRLLAVVGDQGYGVWDAQTGDSIRRGAGSAALSRAAIGRDGIYLAHGDARGSVTVVDLRSGAARPISPHKRAITAVAFSADGKVGASGDVSGTISIWDPEQGALGTLSEGGHQKEVMFLAFDAAGRLHSISKDLLVITWDVPGKRPLRRSTLQADIAGRTIVPNSAAIDADSNRLLVGSQLVSEPRGGMFTDRSGPARPSDLSRQNLLLSYNVATGLSPDPVRTGEFQPDRVSLSPGGCFSFFTSTYREQPRLHVWSLLEQGDDMVRDDLASPAVALALESTARLVAVATTAGRVKVWRVSGAAAADCAAAMQKPTTTTDNKPTIVGGAATGPLILAASATRLAVMRFESTGVDPTLGEGVAEMVAGQLSNSPNVTVIERAAIDSILKELEIQRSGLTTADAVRIGKGLNARKVLLGSIRRFGEGTYVILARLVDVETQQLDGSREVTCQQCKEGDLPAAVEALRRLLVR